MENALLTCVRRRGFLAPSNNEAGVVQVLRALLAE